MLILKRYIIFFNIFLIALLLSKCIDNINAPLIDQSINIKKTHLKSQGKYLAAISRFQFLDGNNPESKDNIFEIKKLQKSTAVAIKNSGLFKDVFIKNSDIRGKKKIIYFDISIIAQNREWHGILKIHQAHFFYCLFFINGDIRVYLNASLYTKGKIIKEYNIKVAEDFSTLIYASLFSESKTKASVRAQKKALNQLTKKLKKLNLNSVVTHSGNIQKGVIK